MSTRTPMLERMFPTRAALHDFCLARFGAEPGDVARVLAELMRERGARFDRTGHRTEVAHG